MNTPQEPKDLLPADVTGDIRLAFGTRLPRVGGALAIMLGDGLGREPETVLERDGDRSRRSMRAKLAQLSTASLVLIVATSGLAVAGALPAPVQEAVSGAAESIGVTLPEGGWEPIPAPDAGPVPVADGIGDDRDDANRSNRVAAPDGERSTRTTEATTAIAAIAPTSTTLVVEPIIPIPTTAPPTRGRPGEGRVAGPPTPPSTEPEPDPTTTTTPETTTSTTVPDTTTTAPETTTTIPETTTTIGEPPPPPDGGQATASG